MNAKPYFYGLEPRWFGANRLYKIFVTRDVLFGAYVAGQFYDNATAAVQLHALLIFLRSWVGRLLKLRAVREARYNEIDLAGPEFLAEDARNFRFERTRVLNITVNRRRCWFWALDSVGDLVVEFCTGERRRFVLVESQDIDAIGEMLRSFHPEAATIGESVAPPTTARRKRQAWKYYAFNGTLLFGFAVLFAVVGFLSHQNGGMPIMFWVAAAMSLIAALACYRMAGKRWKLFVPSEESS